MQASLIAQLVKIHLPRRRPRLDSWVRGSVGEGIGYPLQYCWASLVAQLVKNPPAMGGDLGSIPGSGRSSGGNDNPLQYSCLRNPMDRGAWQATVHGVDTTERLTHLIYSDAKSNSLVDQPIYWLLDEKSSVQWGFTKDLADCFLELKNEKELYYSSYLPPCFFRIKIGRS